MRAFIGLPLPEELRRVAARARDAFIGGDRAWRASADDGLHLTLRFLGPTSADRIESLRPLLLAAADECGALALHVGSPRVFPAGRPRLVWAPVEDRSPDRALERLAARVEECARRTGFPPEDRPFNGHITLARSRRDVRPSRRPVHEMPELGPFAADRMVLFSSEPSPGGSRYHEVAVFRLPAESSR